MRKLIITLACLLLVSSLALCVFAESEDAYVMGVDKTSLYIGETIVIDIKLTNDAKANIYGLMLSYDEDVFEIVEGNVLIDTVDFATFDKNKGTFLFYYDDESATHDNVTVGTVTLKVKDYNSKKPDFFGEHTITGIASVKNDSDVVDVANCEVVVSVNCIEDYSLYDYDKNQHWFVCTCCGRPNPSQAAEDHNFKRGEDTCVNCGYDISDNEPTTPAPTEPAPTEPADDAGSSDGALINVIIVVAVLALFFILGAVIF